LVLIRSQKIIFREEQKILQVTNPVDPLKSSNREKSL
jgi:hypothetical protein